jgi:hypothetical protein
LADIHVPCEEKAAGPLIDEDAGPAAFPTLNPGSKPVWSEIKACCECRVKCQFCFVTTAVLVRYQSKRAKYHFNKQNQKTMFKMQENRCWIEMKNQLKIRRLAPPESKKWGTSRKRNS